MSEPSSPESFWPPTPERLRAYRRQQVVALATILGGVGVAIMIPLGVLVWFETGGVQRYLQYMAVIIAIVCGVFGLTVLLALALVGRTMRIRVERGRALCSHVLEPDEALQVLCPAMFLGPQAYRGGYLAITSQRLIEVLPSFKGAYQRTLARWESLTAIDLTVRQATRNRLAGFLLETVRCERGLTVQDGDQTHFFVLEQVFLDPLCDWIRARGVEVGARNDADLSQRPLLTHAKGEWRSDAAQRRRNLIAVGIPLSLAVMGGIIAGTVIVTTSSSRSVLPAPVIGVSAVASVSLGRIGGFPQGPESSVSQLTVILSGSQLDASGTLRPSLSLRDYEVVRVDGIPYLRRQLPDGRTEWEALGSVGTAGDEALQLAKDRLQN